jgi:hypothetical protein
MNHDEPAECGVCGRWRTGEWLPSGARNPRIGETPHDNFVCNSCAQEARELRTLEQACDRWNERSTAARFRRSSREKVAAWQRPAGTGLPAKG